MNRIKTIVRAIILYTLVTVAIIGICSEPSDENWILYFIVSKAIGFAAVILTVMLVRRWKNEPFIQRLERISKQE